MRIQKKHETPENGTGDKFQANANMTNDNQNNSRVATGERTCKERFSYRETAAVSSFQ